MAFDPLLTAAGLGFVLLALNGADRLTRRRLSGWRGERLVRRLLQEGKLKTAHDVYLPVGVDGHLTQVDHLVLAGDRIAVLETKNHGGRVAGTAQASEWRHRFSGLWFSFPNPLGQNQLHLEAAMGATGLGPGAFIPLIVLPRARLKLACEPGAAAVDLRGLQAQIAAWGEEATSIETSTAWFRLLAIADALGSKEDLRDRHLRQLGVRRPWLREFEVMAGFIIGIWLIWRFGLQPWLWSLT
ncbi:nuclease-related domain-containing protein [Pseudoroseomonas sp. WGS1072]|uniref:nuclease-related domain-containing protein n=1 Tax=Roseomonas sp. WGS1072 TaxID=3366816 RepID=UPI003BEF8BC7